MGLRGERLTSKYHNPKLEKLVRSLVKLGMSSREARVEAKKRLGIVLLTKQQAAEKARRSRW